MLQIFKYQQLDGVVWIVSTLCSHKAKLINVELNTNPTFFWLIHGQIYILINCLLFPVQFLTF